uniref:Uncharacterized protein n=2 Tax=Aegilops tauschii subsp. strangulata TaxID=200361 RepID=A0A453QBQ6_AEGTS
MPEVLKDTKKCIELYPTFYKGCTRKGAILFVSKECDKARERVFLSGMSILATPFFCLFSIAILYTMFSLTWNRDMLLGPL